jgi:hypothetical protein
MDLKKHYETILSEIKKENDRIDLEIVAATTKLKAQKVTNNAHSKSVQKLLDQIDGKVGEKTRQTRQKA